MEDSSYSGIGRPWKLWAWPAVYVAAFVAMMIFGTKARTGPDSDLWKVMAFQALVITGMVAAVKTWERGFTLGNGLRVVGLLILTGLLGIATILAIMMRGHYQG
jgi:4-amino-4-deoxy-L-arabinose transferase-like glycosyltransferase